MLHCTSPFTKSPLTVIHHRIHHWYNSLLKDLQYYFTGMTDKGYCSMVSKNIRMESVLMWSNLQTRFPFLGSCCKYHVVCLYLCLHPTLAVLLIHPRGTSHSFFKSALVINGAALFGTAALFRMLELAIAAYRSS